MISNLALNINFAVSAILRYHLLDKGVSDVLNQLKKQVNSFR